MAYGYGARRSSTYAVRPCTRHGATRLAGSIPQSVPAPTDDPPHYSPSWRTHLGLWLAMALLAAAVGLVALVCVGGAALTAAIAHRVRSLTRVGR